MTNLEHLLELARHEKIMLLYQKLRNCSRDKLLGLYVWDPVAPCIILDESLHHNERLHTCVLAEELGHHFSGIRRNFMITSPGQDRITVSKDETGAMRWATDYLVPDAELMYAVSKLKLRSCWELAEHFQVTQFFMWRKLGFLRTCFRNTGIKVRSRDIFTVEMVPCMEIPAGMAR
ncbi:ImmA/IrrE family metallo-endopeptidase [Desulfotomaculum copahuensis]|uniref:IrrE N-terminal-like domain-containing protein n=1 Tax=Desulfotomaculum copahuensis TaxID=1838280 RepID=A0A1B7LG61_9FIRM|nr:hypothetical protein [Desulfotomaculum copahuensis]OAT83725.1 hypothetical protein A6M21_07765 [Desulfotomaculum copahuensis]